MKGKYLITTDAWFFAPDGKQYRAAWGDVEILSDTVLGVKTNYKSSNWYAKVGNDDKHVVIAGCQIHYAVRCEKAPDQPTAENWAFDKDAGVQNYTHPTNIYIAQ